MPHKVSNDILIPEIARLVEGGQQVIFTPTGISMRPYIEGGVDNVTLARATQIKVGDIVLAQYNDLYVLHRVVRVDAETIVLMGDGNLSGTEKIKKENVLATVVAIHSPKGYRKCIGNGWLWRKLLPIRWLLLKCYRKLILPLARRC